MFLAIAHEYFEERFVFITPMFFRQFHCNILRVLLCFLSYFDDMNVFDACHMLLPRVLDGQTAVPLVEQFTGVGIKVSLPHV